MPGRLLTAHGGRAVMPGDASGLSRIPERKVTLAATLSRCKGAPLTNSGGPNYRSPLTIGVVCLLPAAPRLGATTVKSGFYEGKNNLATVGVAAVLTI